MNPQERKTLVYYNKKTDEIYFRNELSSVGYIMIDGYNIAVFWGCRMDENCILLGEL